MERVVVADYTLADVTELPQGRTRIATVHVLVVDEASLGSALVWEEGEPGVDFPHLYRPLKIMEVTEVRRLRRGKDGAWSAVVSGSGDP